MNDGAPKRDSRWWGWGDPSRQVELPAAGLEFLRDRLGETERSERVSLQELRLPEVRPLPDPVALMAGDALYTGHEDRVRHAAGQSYPDVLRKRTGQFDEVPDAVIVPADAAAVEGLVEACAQERVAIVPFGGGTSVVGGVAAARGGLDAVVSLDLSRLRHVEIDRRSLTARLGPGLRGPEAEAALAVEGLTLGHFPQSFAYATIGGFAATRSAGQASSGVGRFDSLVGSLALATPIGEMRTLETSHTAAGPALRELALGSEGALGVITDVSVRVRALPETRRYEAWMLSGFDAGLDVGRELAQAELLPDLVRLSDASESELARELSRSGGLGARALTGYLRMRRRANGCGLILGWEGDRESVERRRTLAARVLRRSGALYLGQAPGEAWERSRYDGPYLRDALLEHGVMVDTLETAHTWSRLGDLYRSVSAALESALNEQGTPGIVMCHASHLYPDGASLYFTYLARQRRGREMEQWRAVKGAASEAIVRQGATITHHHAVGRDHAPYMSAEVGKVGLAALQAVKERLDPTGIMNPGKLLSA